jgi:hypothetical protein
MASEFSKENCSCLKQIYAHEDQLPVNHVYSDPRTVAGEHAEQAIDTKAGGVIDE